MRNGTKNGTRYVRPELLQERRRKRPTRKQELSNQLKLSKARAGPDLPPSFISLMDELDAFYFHENGDCIDGCPFD